MSKMNLKDAIAKLNQRLSEAKTAYGGFFTKRSGGGRTPYSSSASSSSAAGGLFKWYPRDFGVALAEGVVGHSAFVANTPQKFDSAYSKHFMLIECLAAVPLFCVTTVHYVSSFCMFPGRASMLPGLHNEMANRAKSISFWNEHVTKLSPQTSVLFRGSMLVVQLSTVPVWIFLATASPSVMHCMLERSNEILSMKYAALEKHAPPMIEQLRSNSLNAQDFHKPHCFLTTDYVAAVFLMLFLFFMCS
jgi:hypothetical protein